MDSIRSGYVCSVVIENFTKGLAAGAKQRGIGVSVVAPGPVWTPMLPISMPPEQVSQMGPSESPMGCPAQPVEISPAYIFLASQESSYVNAATLRVAGGVLLGE